MTEERSEQELVRREKLTKLKGQGFSFPNTHKVSATSENVRAATAGLTAGSDEGAASRPRFGIAGRVVAVRQMGKAAFCSIQDRAGRIQIYVRKDDIGDESFEEFKQYDLGDIVFVSGYPFLTKTGEPSVHVERIALLVKCLHPLPEKWHGLTDVEVRYRQRYLDLIVNPDVRKSFEARSRIIASLRRFFDERGYLEVETPILNTVASGASARPFVTHHNTLDMELHLRIALELPLKRLVVGGLERVYEIGRNFRNEGMSTHHNPEFTMIEFYQAYATYETLMDLTEELFVRLCDEVIGSRTIDYDGQTIDFSPGWKRLTMVDSIHEIGGVSKKHDLLTTEGARAAVLELGLKDIAENGEYGLMVFELYDRLVEKKIVSPTFITRFPLLISPLARQSDDDPRFVDRFELVAAGMELANAFSELNDPEEQRIRFEDQLKAREAGSEETMPLDADFVRALEYGLPPTAGQGIGIDRLVMMLTGNPSIRDVILFPTMRPAEE